MPNHMRRLDLNFALELANNADCLFGAHFLYHLVTGFCTQGSLQTKVR